MVGKLADNIEPYTLSDHAEDVVLESPTITVDCGYCEHEWPYQLTLDPTILKCPKCGNATLQQVSL